MRLPLFPLPEVPTREVERDGEIWTVTDCCSNCRHLFRERSYPAECCPYQDRPAPFSGCGGFDLSDEP
jgi:hypothetical protein